ncbi:ABC transporter permease subunit [Pseudonocardia sp. K10HN5]|uniref:ABC transporter permease subunit n=1 Tax=Pseudonocardia acidicola TaxID=2724939 RepID=A0ABX1S3S8_9PSEU|nr:ABC transporter permease subunit [Pseudonocardia acidicola]NMH96176.1 ABC transporter permease subunit [Pseudonocardia acidicola]
MVGVPLLIAVAGPVVAAPARSVAAPLQPPGGGFLLGTDALGRDLLALVLRGGASVVGLTAGALALAYLVAVPLALCAVSSRRRWVDEALVRSLDLLLAVPSLLLVLVLAATGRRGLVPLVLAVALLQLPAVLRLVRAAALAPGCRAAVEAMTLQGEPWWRIHLGYVGRAVLPVAIVDAGTRTVGVLGLLASANFLGLGLPPGSADWAVLVEQNRTALFLQPLAVLVPAGLLVTLCAGLTLLIDRGLAARCAREVRV